MKMSYVSRWLIVASVAVVVLAIAEGSARAQWNPWRQARDGYRRLENSARREAGNAASSLQRAHRMNYRVRVVYPRQRGSQFVYFNFNGENQLALPAGYQRDYRGTMPGRPTIAFDNGRNQQVRYSLRRIDPKLAFVELAQRKGLDPDGDGKLSWKKEFLPELRTRTDELFQQVKGDPTVLADASNVGILNQEHQTVQRFPHES
jgi:hypothetical protein